MIINFKKTTLSKKEVNEKANVEFQDMVDILRDNGVIVLEKDDKVPMKTPDAIFPNNGFSTELKLYALRDQKDAVILNFIILLNCGFIKKSLEL